MVPQLVSVRYRRPGGHWLRLYVPVVPVLVVLAPLLALAVLGGMIACLVFRVRSMAALSDIGRLLCALPGTRVELEEGRTALLIRVR
jgi:hypothetical protein